MEFVTHALVRIDGTDIDKCKACERTFKGYRFFLNHKCKADNGRTPWNRANTPEVK